MQNTDYAKNEITFIKEAAFTKKEERQAEIAELYKKNYERLLVYEKMCEERGIRDVNLKYKFKQGKDKILKEQMRNCKKPKEKRVGMDTQILKDRVESISVKTMAATMKMNNLFEKSKKTKSKSNTKGKSQKKNKTTRLN